MKIDNDIELGKYYKDKASGHVGKAHGFVTYTHPEQRDQVYLRSDSQTGAEADAESEGEGWFNVASLEKVEPTAQ